MICRWWTLSCCARGFFINVMTVRKHCNQDDMQMVDPLMLCTGVLHQCHDSEEALQLTAGEEFSCSLEDDKGEVPEAPLQQPMPKQTPLGTAQCVYVHAPEEA